MNQQARIMCAVDLSWRSEGAFNYAVAIAKARRAPLDVLFAVSDRHPFGWRSGERVLRTRSESASAIADAKSSEFGNAWNNRTSASFDAASDAAHAATRRAESEKVTAQRMRSKRCLLVSIGLSEARVPRTPTTQGARRCYPRWRAETGGNTAIGWSRAKTRLTN